MSTMPLMTSFATCIFFLAILLPQTKSLALVTESRKWLEKEAIESESGVCWGGIQTTVEKREDDPGSWRMNRICLCGGHALHGFVVEMEDGTRRGRIVDNDRIPMGLSDDNIDKRAGVWVDINRRSDVVVRISGYHLNPYNAPPYLCHSLQIAFESGQTIEYRGKNTNSSFRGAAFSWERADEGDDNYYVNDLGFLGGFVTSVKGVRTLSPITYDGKWG